MHPQDIDHLVFILYTSSGIILHTPSQTHVQRQSRWPLQVAAWRFDEKYVVL